MHMGFDFLLNLGWFWLDLMGSCRDVIWVQLLE